MNEQIVEAAVLSNGKYAVLVAGSGGGCSVMRGYALNRWQPDPLAEHDGLVLYLRDHESDETWLFGDGEIGGIRVQADAIEQWIEVDGLRLTCTTTVSSRVNAEKRQIRITNNDDRKRRLDLTSYLELALNAPAADAAHPAFSKLFVQTAFDAERNALLAWRRQRSPTDRTFWVAQRLSGASEYETDRTRFIGRTHTAFNATASLTGTTGTVLDPCFAARAALDVNAGESVDLELVLCAGETREDVEAILDADFGANAGVVGDASVLGLPQSWQEGLSLTLSEKRWTWFPGLPARRAVARSDFGGFSHDGTEYVLQVGDALQPTPQPWINVIANERFGCLISERGAGYTWAANSRENRITRWSNDAVSDPHGEFLYLFDDDSGDWWNLLPGPTSHEAPFEVRHGFGYSRFTNESDGVRHEVCVFVARHDPVRFARVKVENTSGHARNLSVLSCAELVLGSTPAATRRSVRTSYDNGVITARNPDRGEFSERIAFAYDVGADRARRSATGSRRSFRDREDELDGRFGDDLDPCAALLRSVVVQPGETLECAFLLGEADDETALRQILARYTSTADVDRAFAEVTDFWRELLSAVHITTPVPALDVMVNGWLAYQNLACRMWARSAFYQSGGAFGFRDQLQDSSALLYLDPQITRDQILLHAAHQFREGDVLHWWHPPTSKGIRTRFADDLLWLPYITLFYLDRTDDVAILDEAAGFLTAPLLDEGDDEIFVHPEAGGETASLHEHCCRAIDRSLTKGARGLPLIGVGDWNDGMNRVGREGRGESVWMGFFLFEILSDFIPLCVQRGDDERAQRYADYLDELHTALNEAGWDGSWYRRAYYDNGDPLGSAESEECRIDALAQAWAVISGAASSERAAQALAATQQHLVDEQNGIIRLLTPPFDRTSNDPGYIKGYVPGVRENGGQYTHAALWAVRALCEMGERERGAQQLEMLSPVTRARQPEIYQGEPYVIAADVYGEAPHVGRAGWTWYTGSAGWMYRVCLESVLGFDLRGDIVRLRPCVPASWPGYTIRYRRPDGTTYRFAVEVGRKESTTSEGRVVNGYIEIPLASDGAEHVINIVAGADVTPSYEPSTPPLLRMASE